MTEQVERTVEVEQNGDTHVEVCRVSQCSEVVALDSNLRPLSGKSGEDQQMMDEEEEKQPMSPVSSSSHALQLLKEDQDDDLPPSASQCSCRNEASPTSETGSVNVCQNTQGNEGERESRAGSAASVSHSRAATPYSTADPDETHDSQRFEATASRASCRSSKAGAAASEGVADDEDEEIMRLVSGLSGRTDGSAQSSLCPHCGGSKRLVNSVSNSRSSKRSSHSQNAPPKAAPPLPNQEHANEFTADDDDDDDASNVSGVSTKSNKTNLSNHDCFSVSNVTRSRACSTTSKMSNPETKQEERASSVRSHRSNASRRSGCNSTTGDVKDGERVPSAMSTQSRKSHRSNNNGATDETDVKTEAEEPGDTERPLSSLSAKTGASSKRNAGESVKLCINEASQSDSISVEEGATDKRPASVLDDIGKLGRPESVASAKSNASIKTNRSQRSNCSKCATAVSPCANEAAPDKLQEEERETEDRAASTNSHRSNKVSERSISPRSKPEDSNRSMSKMSGRSAKTDASVKSSKSHKSNRDANETVVTVNATEREEKEGEVIEEETQPAESVAPSTKSNENQGATSESGDTTGNDDVQEKAEVTSMEERALSAMSGNSHSTAKSSRPQNCSAPPDPTNEDGLERATSAMSAKSKSSAKSSHKSNSGRSVHVKSPHASSGKPRAASALSHKSSHNGETDVAVTETADADDCGSERSRDPSLSRKSTRSPMIESSKVSPTPSGGPRSPVKQLLPDPAVNETRGPSALSVHSVKSAKSGRSKCSCRAASPNQKMEEEEDKDVKSEELSERPASILSPSNKRVRKESGGTEGLLSRNSSGSISIGLPEDTASSDSWKSSVSGRGRSKTRSPDGGVKEDRGSVISQKSNFTESKSAPNLPIINIQTIKTPGQSHDSGEQNPVRASSAVTSKSSRSRKSCKCSVKSGTSRSASRPKSSDGDEHVARTLEGDSVKSVSRPTSKAKNKEDADSPCCFTPEVAPLDDSVKCPKVTSNGSVKSSSSKRNEPPAKSPSPCPAGNTSPASKLETCSESTLSQSLSAADMLRETVATARPSSRRSKTSKTSNKSRRENHQENQNLIPHGILELTPTCLPNASPNEVVSEWLKSIPADSSMLDFGDDLHADIEQEKVEENPVEDTAGGEGPEDRTVDEEGETKHVEDEEKENKEEEENEEKNEEENEDEELKAEGAAGDPVDPSQPKTLLLSTNSVPRNWQSSAAVMKVLLSSSLGRCQSLPEVRKRELQ